MTFSVGSPKGACADPPDTMADESRRRINIPDTNFNPSSNVLFSDKLEDYARILWAMRRMQIRNKMGGKMEAKIQCLKQFGGNGAKF